MRAKAVLEKIKKREALSALEELVDQGKLSVTTAEAWTDFSKDQQREIVQLCEHLRSALGEREVGR
jgi:hypothetical protein